MELEKKWQQTFADRAVRCRHWHEISHWTLKGFQTRRRKIGRELRHLYKPGQRVIDLGSGPGVYADHFERPVLFDYAREVFRRTPMGLDAFRVCGDLKALPFRAASFDGLLSVGVLQCRRLERRDIAAAAALLKPGGWFLVETLNCESASLYYELSDTDRLRLVKFMERTDCDPCYFILDEYVIYQASKLIPWFEEAGLAVHEVRYLCTPDPFALVRNLVANPSQPRFAMKRYAKSFYLLGMKKSS